MLMADKNEMFLNKSTVLLYFCCKITYLMAIFHGYGGDISRLFFVGYYKYV